MKKISLNSASKIYINGIIASVITIFIVTGVVFLLVVSNKLDIVMNSEPGVTYTYFVMIMDRIIALAIILAVLPLSIYQWISKDKTARDRVVCAISVIIFALCCMVLICGEMRFYDKYQSGGLNGTQLFSEPVIEMKIMDSFYK